MGLNPFNSNNLQQLALKGLILEQPCTAAGQRPVGLLSVNLASRLNAFIATSHVAVDVKIDPGTRVGLTGTGPQQKSPGPRQKVTGLFMLKIEKDQIATLCCSMKAGADG